MNKTLHQPMFDYGHVPYSELAMHCQIAGQSILGYKIRPNKYGAEVLTDKGWTDGLISEVLSWEIRRREGVA